MNRLRVSVVAALTGLTFIACVRVAPPALHPTAGSPGATLWREPANLKTRDTFYGPWGSQHAPDPRAVYTLLERKHSGVNLGMTVSDPQGREWNVKQAPPGGLDHEGAVEVVVSRLLTAIGYHQPPVYFLPAFTVKDDWGTHTEIGGRFRLKDTSLKEVDSWSWQENPFIGSRPYQGLLALMMMLNATDLKDSNNTLYEHRTGDLIEQWYVTRDVGAALGDLHRFAPIKGDPVAFARDPFIRGVRGGFVEFAYNGWYRDLVRDRISPASVAWVSGLLAQLSDRQLRDAFRAGGYDAQQADRFIATLREKISQGRALGERTRR